MVADLFQARSINQLLEEFRQKTLGPVEVAHACIERYRAADPSCQAWVRFDGEHLLRQARAAEQRLLEGLPLRSLEGMPVGVKDIFNTMDFPTEMGSPLWSDFTPGNDARALFHLQREGAVVPGKTVTAEFAVHTLGKTLNPHNKARNPGTSSSGSAVAVAMSMVPVSLGTQTAGSIVRPASFCGVYGCKPSFGLIPRTGMLKTTDSLDTVGFFCVHYEDLQRVFEAIRVHGLNYPVSHRAFADPARLNKPAGRPWRVAVLKPAVLSTASDYAVQALQGWIHRFTAQIPCEVEDVTLSDSLNRAHQVHATIYNKSLSYYFKEEFQRAELVSPIMNDLIRRGQAIQPEAYRQALKDQEHMAAEMDQLMAGYDVGITLSTAGVAPLRDEVEEPDSALVWNLTYLPVISAPAFVSSEGLPFGLQIVSRRYNDYLLFNFCNALREADLIPKANFPKPPVLT